MSEPITGIAFELDGAPVEARPGETIWAVAQRLGTHIPHLCHRPEPGYRPDGNCRACMVEIEGERVLAASCKRTPAIGMQVRTASDRATRARAMVMELLIADQPARATSPDPDLAVLVGSRLRRARDQPLPCRTALGPGPEPPRDAGEPRRVHPVQPVRARVPRGAGQRRDRDGLRGRTAPRSSSISTTRWASPRASGAASASRRARRARSCPRRTSTTSRCGSCTPIARSTRCARTAASGARSPTR